MQFFRIKSRLIFCLLGNIALLLILAFYWQSSLETMERFAPLVQARENQLESINLLPAALLAMDSELQAYATSLQVRDLESFKKEQEEVDANLRGLDNVHVLPTPLEAARQDTVERWMREIGQTVWPPDQINPNFPSAQQMPSLLQKSRALLRQLRVLSTQVRAENRQALQGLQTEQNEELQDRLHILWILVGAVIFFSMLLQISVSNSIILPLQKLAQAVVHWQQGNYVPRVRIKTADEIQTLAETLNEMADSIQSSQAAQWQAQAQLEERVREKTRELEEKNVKLHEASRQKDQFIATLSHELRTPLTPILSSTHLLALSGRQGTEELGTLKIIERNARALSRMIDELLDLSATMAEKLHLLRESTEINAWAEHTLRPLQSFWEKKGLHLNFQPWPEPIFLEIDASRLAQILTNLLTNAIKFTPADGQITVKIEALAERIQIQVIDSGIGLAAEEQERIFEMFHQARTGLSGLGVGLTVARALAELHGGGLLAQSEGLNRGTSFTLWLPRLHKTETRPLPAPVRSRLSRHTGPVLISPAVQDVLRGRRILLIEDTSDTREILARILERRGCQVFTAADGATGLRLAREERPSVILSDIGLPDISGLEVIRLLRADPDFRDTIAIAISGYGRDQDTAAALAAGYQAHLLKPVEIPILERTLIEALLAKN